MILPYLVISTMYTLYLQTHSFFPCHVKLMSLAITASNHFGSAPVTMYAPSPLVSPQQIIELKNMWMKEPDFERHLFSKDLFDDGGFEDVDKDSFPNEGQWSCLSFSFVLYPISELFNSFLYRHSKF